jgi:hypothetical protein
MLFFYISLDGQAAINISHIVSAHMSSATHGEVKLSNGATCTLSKKEFQSLIGLLQAYSFAKKSNL